MWPTSSTRCWWSSQTDSMKTWWNWSKSPSCCDSLVRPERGTGSQTSVCNIPVLIAWLYLNDEVDDVDPACVFWRAANTAVCIEMSSFVCFLCRCQRSADCGAGGSAWPGPAADGGVWTRIRIQASSQHRHAECWQRPPQTNCKWVMSLKTDSSAERWSVYHFCFCQW